MPYFVVTGTGSADCLAMLDPDVVRDERLANLATVVEGDIIAHYTKLPHSPGYRPDYPGGAGFVDLLAPPTVTDAGVVCLRGYNADPAQANVGLLRALRREIAEVIRWRHGQLRKRAGVASESSGDPATSKSYTENADEPFPPAFGRFLREYDLRPAW